MGKTHPKVLRHGLPSLQLDQLPCESTAPKSSSARPARAAVREVEAVRLVLPTHLPTPSPIPSGGGTGQRGRMEPAGTWGDSEEQERDKAELPCRGKQLRQAHTHRGLDSDDTTAGSFVDLFNVPEHQATPKSIRTPPQKRQFLILVLCNF